MNEHYAVCNDVIEFLVYFIQFVQFAKETKQKTRTNKWNWFTEYCARDGAKLIVGAQNGCYMLTSQFEFCESSTKTFKNIPQCGCERWTWHMTIHSDNKNTQQLNRINEWDLFECACMSRDLRKWTININERNIIKEESKKYEGIVKIRHCNNNSNETESETTFNVSPAANYQKQLSISFRAISRYTLTYACDYSKTQVNQLQHFNACQPGY